MEVGSKAVVDGTLWRVKRARGKVTWDHDALLRRMLTVSRDARTVTADGEVESEAEAAIRVTAECAGISYWRVNDLKRYDTPADEYRSTDLGAVTVTAEEEIRG
ncbi:MAG: hypothetical protein V4492_02035 [Chlamydiota bacterium]